jgi:hypothetical protein
MAMESKEIIDALRKCSANTAECRKCPVYNQSAGCLDLLHQQAVELIEKLLEERRWIPVTERLPEFHIDDYKEPDGSRMQFEVSVDQWVVTTSGYQTKARYEKGVVFQGWVDEHDRSVRSVTHWRSMPEPPEEAAK